MNTDLTDLTAIRQRAEAATVYERVVCGGVLKDQDAEQCSNPGDGVDHIYAGRHHCLIPIEPNPLDRIEALERALVTARTAINELLIDSGLGKTALPLRSKAQAQQALTEIAGVLGAETAAATGKEAGL